jgi:predicted ATP-grasp superfamily ATP-dependent carboligase
LLGLDCRTGLQSARLFAQRGVPVYGLAHETSSPYCRTRSVRQVEDVRPFLADPSDWLRQFATRHGAVPVLLPCTDEFVLWMNAHRDAVDGNGLCVQASSRAIETLVDKTKLYRFALEHGWRSRRPASCGAVPTPSRRRRR